MELHLTPKTIGRGTGRQVVAAAAYRAGAALTDERSGERFDFSRRGGVARSEIIAPLGAVPWALDREQLWNEAERAEDKSTRRATARTAREFEVSLPHQLSAEDRQALGLGFTRWLVDRYGFVADVAFHDPHKGQDPRNFHMHILTTTRVMADAGFGGKVRELDFAKTASPEILEVRKTFADMANGFLERAGIAERVEHLSFERRGIDKEASVHMGPSATAMEKRGEATDVGNLNRDIEARNADRSRLKAEHAKVSGEIINLQATRAQKADDRAERAEAKTLDPARILAAITERRATFTRADLARVLKPQIADGKARSDFMAEILNRHEVIPLRENINAPVSRYTTRDVLAGERQVMAASQRMASRGGHGVSASILADTLDHHHHLDGEQRAALDHATKPGSFAMIAGEAGTGKSTTLAAIRNAYEGAGYTVRGLAWQNIVMQDLKANGFRDANTIMSELSRQDGGRAGWDSRTVLMVEEAGQVSTKHLAALMTMADAAGAKVILAGDDKQLSSIERGGMFGALKNERGAAELHTVYRVHGDDQKAAFNAMHRGDFRAALETFDQRGAIRWTKEPEDARAALVQKWADDKAENPALRQMVFAYTNAEVRELNRDLRTIRKERGELGEEQVLKTRDGEAAFAVGDRMQFTASGNSRAKRDAGFYNGATGSVEAIEGNRVTLALDVAKGAEPRRITFTVGGNAEAGEFDAIRHGYASTVYKGQGKTLDRSYVLHSEQWRAATAYVALTRHRDEVALFASERGAAWMHAEGGLAGLTEKQKASAEKSYAAWAEAKPELAAKYGIADYVSYVQGEALATKDADRLDRMARQMGRVEEIRAASQFVQGPAILPDDTAGKPPVYGRYDELRALGEAVEARKAAARPNTQADAAKPTSEPEKPADRPMTADERFAARMAKVQAEVTKKPDSDTPQDITEYVRERSRERPRGPSR